MSGYATKLWGMADEVVNAGRRKLFGPREVGKFTDPYGASTAQRQNPELFADPYRAVAGGVTDSTHEDIKLARQMADRGEDLDMIQQKTGITVDPADDTMHVWLPGTETATVDPALLAKHLASPTGGEEKLGKFLQHEELFKANPEMDDYKVKFEDLGTTVSGMHNGPDQIIRINNNKMMQKLNPDNFTPEGVKEIVIHETQHALDSLRTTEGRSIIERAIEAGATMESAAVAAMMKSMPGSKPSNFDGQEVLDLMKKQQREALESTSKLADVVLQNETITKLVDKTYYADSKRGKMSQFLKELASEQVQIERVEKAKNMIQRADPLHQGSMKASLGLQQDRLANLQNLKKMVMALDPQTAEDIKLMQEYTRFAREVNKNYLGNPGEMRARVSMQVGKQGVPHHYRNKNLLKHAYDFEERALDMAMERQKEWASHRSLTRGKMKPVARDPYQSIVGEDPLAPTVR